MANTKKKKSTSSKKKANNSKKTSTTQKKKTTNTQTKPKTTSSKNTTPKKKTTVVKEENDIKKEDKVIKKELVIGKKEDPAFKASIEIDPHPKKEEKETSFSIKVTPVNSILGTDLPIGQDKTSKKERIRYYLKDATLYAIIIPVLDLFAMLFIKNYEAWNIVKDNTPVNYCLTLLIDFVIIFILTYIVDYAQGEMSVKHYHKVEEKNNSNENNN